MAAGFQVQVVEVPLGGAIASADFVLLGHASQAGMAVIKTWLNENPYMFSSSIGLAVGSGALYIYELLGREIRTQDRVSAFEVSELEGLRVLGYRNTDTDAPNLEQVDDTLLTMLHGPILAKNPALLELVAKKVVARAGKSWPTVTPKALENLDAQLNRICAAIWSLEAEEELPTR